jgi:hypothetical protein
LPTPLKKGRRTKRRPQKLMGQVRKEKPISAPTPRGSRRLRNLRKKRKNLAAFAPASLRRRKKSQKNNH